MRKCLVRVSCRAVRVARCVVANSGSGVAPQRRYWWRSVGGRCRPSIDVRTVRRRLVRLCGRLVSLTDAMITLGGSPVAPGGSLVPVGDRPVAIKGRLIAVSDALVRVAGSVVLIRESVVSPSTMHGAESTDRLRPHDVLLVQPAGAVVAMADRAVAQRGQLVLVRELLWTVRGSLVAIGVCLVALTDALVH